MAIIEIPTVERTSAVFGFLSKFLPGKLGKSRKIIPVVRIHGGIGMEDSVRSGISISTISDKLEDAFSIKKAPVVVIQVNSPGGSPVQSQLIYQRIRALAEENKKEVLVFIEDVAASGGYMIALAGDEIFASECSIVGSIGVVSSGFGLVDLISKLGVERRVHTSGDSKSFMDPFVPEKKEDVKHLKDLQSQIHEFFIDLVKSRRKKLQTQEKDLFSGLFWVGLTARRLGLVDEIGDLRSVITKRFGEDVKYKLFDLDKSFLRRKLGISVRSGGASAGLARELVSVMEERLMWSRYGL